MPRTLALLSLLAAPLALAQGTTGPGSDAPVPVMENADTPDAKAAKALVEKYLTAVKAKKWADAKKLVHPETIKVIAERKKRLGKEDHPMAPWFYEKTDHFLKAFKVVGARAAPLGTVVVDASEDNFRVEEKGLAEGEAASYLVGRKEGTWYVVDKKRLETFPDDSVKIGYKGWFDKLQKAE